LTGWKTASSGPKREEASLRILVTCHAGFIGFHVAKVLLREGHAVHGLDFLNDYYDVNLKHRRLAQLQDQHGFCKTHAYLEDHEGLLALFERFRPEKVPPSMRWKRQSASQRSAS
jgi:UDP-glucuronate 4-epimerase